MIQSLIMEIIPGLTVLFSRVLIPIAGELLKFTIPKLVNLPLYLKLLWTIYTDKKDDKNEAEARKYLTSTLIVLSSILTFLTYSYIPLTGVPIIGAFTTPVAAMLAIVICLVALDFIFNLNQAYYQNKYPEEFKTITKDINELANTLGDSYETLVKQTQSLLDAVKEKLDPHGKYDDTLLALIEALDRYFRNPYSDPSLSKEEITKRIITEGLPPFAKIGGSLAEGALVGSAVGSGVYGAATSLFVKAGLLTGIKTFFGLGGGIAVSASAYTALTVAAPIGLAIVGGTGVFSLAKFLRDQGEKTKLSAFIADVIIASLAMAWSDGELCQDEKDTLERFLLNPILNKKDVQRIRSAQAQHLTFDDVLHLGLLKEDNERKAKMKYRFLLCTAYELAAADGLISPEEINLHNRMANFMKIPLEEVQEIRRTILLKSGINVKERIKIVQGDLLEQKVEAIVNSTNPNLLPGKKLGWLPLPADSRHLDRVIHQRAGAELKAQCQSLHGCNIGEAKITSGYHLPLQIIHTVTPIWQDGQQGETDLLAQCYDESLKLADDLKLRTISFPALGTGTGNFPLLEAARVAISTIENFLNLHFSVEQVNLVCLDSACYEVYRQVFEESQLPLPLLEGGRDS